MKKLQCLAILFSLLLMSCGESNSSTKETPNTPNVTIPMGGNTYLTAGTEGVVEKTGITGWSSPQSVFSTYFRVNKAGSLRVFLKYAADADGNVIQATIGGKKMNVSLPKSTSADEASILLGTLDNCPEGYIQVDLKGLTLKGKVYATPSALLLDGTAITTAPTYVQGVDNYYWGRRGPSVHMNYPIPEGKTAEWFYNEVTVPVGEDTKNTFFMTNGFGEGYFGMQAKTNDRWVIFSVWSPFKTDDPNAIPESHKVKLVKKGSNVVGGEFGNEGAGGQSYLVYDWKAGTTYKFLNRVRPAANGYSEYTAYFYAPEVGKWQLIAQFLRPETNTYYKRPHSFLENFDPTTGHQGRKGYYNNQWIYTTTGEWIELTKGGFTIDNTGRSGWRKDYKGGVDASGFFLQNCGFFNDFVEYQSAFDRTPMGVAPVVDWKTLP